MKLMVNSLVLCLGFFVIIPIQVQAQACADYKIVSPLIEQTQVFSDWCTSAAVRVVTRHYGRTDSQCELQGMAVSSTCCPPSAHTPGNDPTCHPDGIWPPEILNKIKFTFTPFLSPPPWTTITTEICNDRPILSVTSVVDLNNLHSVVVEGFERQIVGIGEIRRVRVFDPQNDLCDLSCAPEDQNPKFYTEDEFYHSGYDHDTDYIQIAPPPTDLIPPQSPGGLTVQ